MDDTRSAAPGIYARVLPHLRASHPSLGTDWYPVLGRNPDALTPDPGPDRVWIVVGGRPRLLPIGILDVADRSPESVTGPGRCSTPTGAGPR
jgi:hypothetical protein